MTITIDNLVTIGFICLVLGIIAVFLSQYSYRRRDGRKVLRGGLVILLISIIFFGIAEYARFFPVEGAKIRIVPKYTNNITYFPGE